MSRAPESAGFTLAEVLVALLLTSVVMAGALALVDAASAAARTLPVAADIQQRVRVATDALSRDLGLAGGGSDGGPSAGPLLRHLPPVLPRRLGAQGADPVTVASAQTLTIIYVPRTPAETTTSAAIGPASLQLQLSAEPACPSSPVLCGLSAGSGVLLLDPAVPDHFDLFTLVGVSGSVGTLSHRDSSPSSFFQAGAAAAEVVMHTYYLDAVNHQLRDYDGNATDVPLADHVVDLRFEYFGDPVPPALPKPAAGVENCLYDASGAAKPMAVLAPEGGSLAPLPLSLFTDGPWCGTGAMAFDADLLRIRRIRVTIRFEAALTDLRSIGPAFIDPGTSRSAMRSLPDVIATFDVAPRNLDPWR